MNIFPILVAAFVVQQPPVTSIEGTVVQLGTSQPVANAIVQANAGSGREYAMTTAADGKFEFQNLAPGTYRLNVSRNGFLDSAYGRRGQNGRGRVLSIGAGQAAKDIQLAMIPLAAIAGRVYDSNGEPLANITVRALRYSYVNGERMLTPVKMDETDDHGEYRIFWLPPGLYYVSATPTVAETQDALLAMVRGAPSHVGTASGGVVPAVGVASSTENSGEAYAPVYYPGTPDLQVAAAVEVRSGADSRGIDFTLSRVALRTVRGIAIDGTTGRPATSASVMLVPAGASLAGALPARPSGDGTFEIKGVLPGSYFLAAIARVGAGKGSTKILGGRSPVEVSSADVDRVTVVTAPSVDIPGQVIGEGVRDNTAANSHPTVTLKNELTGAPGPLSERFAEFSNGRQFVINDVIEGEYQVQLTDVPAGAYVKSIRFGSADVLNDRLQMDSRSRDYLEIVLSTNGGALDGTVVDRNRQAMPNVPVALVPEARYRQRGDLYKTATTDPSGNFHLQAIAPGEYVLFAWEDIEDGLWRDPEFTRRNEAYGRAIHITEGSRENVEITATPFAY